MRIARRRLAPALLFLLSAVPLAVLGLYEPSRQAKILTLESGPRGMTAVLQILPADASVNLGQGVSVSPGSGEVDLGGKAFPVRPGLKVHLVIQFGGAVLRPVVGLVTKMLPGDRCEAKIDPASLDKTVQDPTNGNTHQVREYLVTGAEVSLSED